MVLTRHMAAQHAATEGGSCAGIRQSAIPISTFAPTNTAVYGDAMMDSVDNRAFVHSIGTKSNGALNRNISIEDGSAPAESHVRSVPNDGEGQSNGGKEERYKQRCDLKATLQVCGSSFHADNQKVATDGQAPPLVPEPSASLNGPKSTFKKSRKRRGYAWTRPKKTSRKQMDASGNNKAKKPTSSGLDNVAPTRHETGQPNAMTQRPLKPLRRAAAKALNMIKAMREAETAVWRNRAVEVPTSNAATTGSKRRQDDEDTLDGALQTTLCAGSSRPSLQRTRRRLQGPAAHVQNTNNKSLCHRPVSTSSRSPKKQGSERKAYDSKATESNAKVTKRRRVEIAAQPADQGDNMDQTSLAAGPSSLVQDIEHRAFLVSTDQEPSSQGEKGEGDIVQGADETTADNDQGVDEQMPTESQAQGAAPADTAELLDENSGPLKDSSGLCDLDESASHPPMSDYTARLVRKVCTVSLGDARHRWESLREASGEDTIPRSPSIVCKEEEPSSPFLYALLASPGIPDDPNLDNESRFDAASDWNESDGESTIGDGSSSVHRTPLLVPVQSWSPPYWMSSLPDLVQNVDMPLVFGAEDVRIIGLGGDPERIVERNPDEGRGEIADTADTWTSEEEAYEDEEETDIDEVYADRSSLLARSKRVERREGLDPEAS